MSDTLGGLFGFALIPGLGLLPLAPPALFRIFVGVADLRRRMVHR